MHSLLDNDVDSRPTATKRTAEQYPVTELVRSYLQQTGNKFFRLGTARLEQPEPSHVQDLWDYLGDFA